MSKLPVILLGFVAALLAAAAVVAGLTPARAQDNAPPPANVRVADGETAGAVTLSWNAVDAAAFYRIGWVAMDDIPTVQAQGREWLDAFIFTDVANLGQSTYTITALVPGREYAFIVASVPRRFGAATWSRWTYLTPAGVASCPADGGEPPPNPAAATPTPMPTATPAPTPSPTTAAQSSVPPCVIFGKVTIRGNTAPEGTIVQARIKDAEDSFTVQTQTDADGNYMLTVSRLDAVFDLFVDGEDTGVDTPRTVSGGREFLNLSIN